MESSSKTKMCVLLTAHFDSQHWVIIIDPLVFTWNPLCLIHALPFPKMQSFTGRIFRSTQHWLIFDFTVSTPMPVANVFKTSPNIHHHLIPFPATWASHCSKSFSTTLQVTFLQSFLSQTQLMISFTPEETITKRQSWSSYAGYKEALLFLKAHGKWFFSADKNHFKY